MEALVLFPYKVRVAIYIVVSLGTAIAAQCMLHTAPDTTLWNVLDGVVTIAPMVAGGVAIGHINPDPKGETA